MRTPHLLYVLVSMIMSSVAGHAATVLNIRLLLEGPYLPETGMMRAGMIASKDRYGSEPFKMSILTFCIPDGVTDWVYVEFRKEPHAMPVASTACFLRYDGRVIDTTGRLPVFDEQQLPQGEYYIVVSNRNHCAVVSARPVSLSDYSVCYDFSLAQDMAWNAETQPMKKLRDGVYALRAGDINRDGRKDPTDIVQWTAVRADPGNPQGDLNLDGVTDILDSVLLLRDYPYTSFLSIADSSADIPVIAAAGFVRLGLAVGCPLHTLNNYSVWCWSCRGEIIVEACTLSGQLIYEQVMGASGGKLLFPLEMENGKYLLTLWDVAGKHGVWTYEIELFRSPGEQ